MEKQPYKVDVCQNAASCKSFSLDNPLCYQHSGCSEYTGNKAMKIEDEIDLLGIPTQKSLPFLSKRKK